MVTRDQLGNCIGSHKDKNWHEEMTTETSDASRLVVLYFRNVLDAIGICDKEAAELLLKEIATLSSYELSPITATSDNFKFHEFYFNELTTAAYQQQEVVACSWSA